MYKSAWGVIWVLGIALCLPCMGIADAVSRDKSVVFATMNWEPVHGESLPEGGVFAVLTREAFKRSGYEFDVEFLPLKRAMSLTKKGHFDGIMGAVMTSEREPFYEATDKIMSSDGLLFSRSEETIAFTSWCDLKKYRIGTIRGTSIDEKLVSAGFKTEKVVDYGQNFRKLLLKRIDLMGGDMLVMNDFLEKNPQYDGKIKPLATPVNSLPVYNLVSKSRSDYAAVVADFNRGLLEIIADGTFNEIVERYGFDYLAKGPEMRNRKSDQLIPGCCPHPARCNDNSVFPGRGLKEYTESAC